MASKFEGHTKGPWTHTGRYVGVPNHQSFIAECRDQNGNWTNEPMALNNATLIAAAPELLALAVELRGALEELQYPLSVQLEAHRTIAFRANQDISETLAYKTAAARLAKCADALARAAEILDKEPKP